MAENKPPDVRSIITDDEFGGFRITIPPKKGAGCCAGCFFALWALVVAFVFLFIVSDPRDNFTRGTFVFLGFWVALALSLGLLLAAIATEQEVLMIEGKTLVLRHEFLGLRREHSFELSEVRNLRTQHSAIEGRLGVGSCVAFDHGNRTYRFGAGLSMDEVRRLVKTIRSRFPIRNDWDDVEPLFPTEG